MRRSPVPDQQFYGSRYGATRLFISRLTTTKSRTQVVHELSSGDDHVVQDRGREIVRARAELLFDWMRGDTLTPLDRLNEFKSQVDDEPHIFQHPIEGSFSARVAEFEYVIEGSGPITATCEFIAISEIVDVLPAGAAAIPATGIGAVDSASEKYEDEYAELGLNDIGLGDTSRHTVDAWDASDDVNPRQIFVDTGSLTQQLGDQSSQLEDDIEMWEAFKSTLLLADAVRRAAEAATSDTPTTFAFKSTAPVALRALLASIYGASEVDERYVQAMRLNDIATPALLDVGAELQLPTPTPRARNG